MNAIESTIEQTPDYHHGFYDAAEGSPLFDDASPAYKAGWLALWDCKELWAKALRDGGG